MHGGIEGGDGTCVVRMVSSARASKTIPSHGGRGGELLRGVDKFRVLKIFKACGDEVTDSLGWDEVVEGWRVIGWWGTFGWTRNS